MAKGHAAGLTVGWYTNNIECHGQEQGWSNTPALHQKHYAGVASWLAKTGFDEVKVDSGGRFGDFDTWQRVLNATGRPIALENCHVAAGAQRHRPADRTGELPRRAIAERQLVPVHAVADRR